MLTSYSLQPRPWLIDDYDKWIEAIAPGRSPYRCVLIFCDNSGPDVLLGVLPFALEFISRGSKVILAANSGKSIFVFNDVCICLYSSIVDCGTFKNFPCQYSEDSSTYEI